MRRIPWAVLVLVTSMAMAIGVQPLSAQGPMALGSHGLTFPDGSVQTTAATRPSYYVTDLPYLASDALLVCADGYVMASLWELLDPSNLVYATDHPDAALRADAGQGPPSVVAGWIRTGNASSLGGDPGQANCANWQSSLSEDLGTTAALPGSWTTTPAGPGGVWELTTVNCSSMRRVWCIESRSSSGTAALASPQR